MALNLDDIRKRLINDSGEVERIPDPDTVKWLIETCDRQAKAIETMLKCMRRATIEQAHGRGVRGSLCNALAQVEEILGEKD